MFRISARRRPRGFTLLEVMLSLAVLVAIAAITWPALQGPMAAQRLRNAADQVRSDWVRARLDAMQSGQAYIFRFEAGAGQYSIEPYSLGEMLPATTQPGITAAPAVESLPAMARSRTLPEEVVFAAGQTLDDARGASLMASGGFGATAAVATPPILFYPDGTASTASVMLAGENDNLIELQLRGLTGIVTIGEMFRGNQEMVR